MSKGKYSDREDIKTAMESYRYSKRSCANEKEILKTFHLVFKDCLLIGNFHPAKLTELQIKPSEIFARIVAFMHSDNNPL